MTEVSEAASPESGDIRPIVGADRGNRPLWLGLGAILFVGLLLFLTLESRRQAALAPAVRPRASDLAATSSPVPPLYVPPIAFTSEPPPALPVRLTSAVPEQPARAPAPQTAAPTMSAPPVAMTVAPPAAIAAPRAPEGPAIVFDSTVGVAADAPGVAGPGAGAPAAAIASRARAARVANAATIVPQGTLISAVLETALDSTQPGQARALVSRDVVNLRGDRVLIPRGSRLFGTYKGELASGQKRAQVEWTRLVRPDGVTIAIDSPAADRLGRAGVRGRVNTYFLERLGGALLQTSIDVGGALATRSIGGDTVIVALPGAVQGASSQLVGTPPKPTIRVKQGTRVSVFVSRDLDFTSVEPRR